MAGEEVAHDPAMPLPHHVVAGPPISNNRIGAIRDRSGHLVPKEPTCATWTSADPPSGRLAGVSADDPVLGGRLGRGHRAAQPAAAITHKATSHPVQLLAIGGVRCGRHQAASAPAGAGHAGGAGRRLGAGARRPPRRSTRQDLPDQPAAALVAGRWPTGSGSGRSPPSPGDSNRRNPTSTMVSRRPQPQRRVRVFAAATPPGPGHAIRRTRAYGVPGRSWRW
jgi:hypothetical protein